MKKRNKTWIMFKRQVIIEFCTALYYSSKQWKKWKETEKEAAVQFETGGATVKYVVTVMTMVMNSTLHVCNNGWLTFN